MTETVNMCPTYSCPLPGPLTTRTYPAKRSISCMRSPVNRRRPRGTDGKKSPITTTSAVTPERLEQCECLLSRWPFGGTRQNLVGRGESPASAMTAFVVTLTMECPPKARTCSSGEKTTFSDSNEMMKPRHPGTTRPPRQTVRRMGRSHRQGCRLQQRLRKARSSAVDEIGGRLNY